MYRNGTVRQTTILASRPTPREGNGSPALKVAAEEKRTTDARLWYEKTAKRQKRRSYKNAGEMGLEKLLAYRRAQRENEVSNVSQEQAQTILHSPAHKKIIPSKPARRITSRKPATKKVRICSPETLKERRERALVRYVKRVLKKILKFAIRQSGKYGHALYLIVLELFCLKCQDFILQNPKEGL